MHVREDDIDPWRTQRSRLQTNFITSKAKDEVYVCHISQYDFWGETCHISQYDFWSESWTGCDIVPWRLLA